MNRIVIVSTLVLVVSWPNAVAELIEYQGSANALPYEEYINVISEADSPILETYIKAKDGVYIAAAIRQPKGDGPYPALIMFHGAPGGRGMTQLAGWSRGDHGGPVWERFIQEGFAVIVADYRGGPFTEMNTPSDSGLTTAIDDGISVIEFVRQLPYIDQSNVNVYGVSLGGNLAMYMASKVPDLNAVIAGAPAPIWFLGCELPAEGSQLNFSSLKANPEISKNNILPIQSPILLQVGTRRLSDRANNRVVRPASQTWERGAIGNL